MRHHRIAWGAVAAWLLFAAPAMASPTTTLVDLTNSGGQPSAKPGNDVAISGDGRYVVFVSAAANLVAGDSNQAVDVFVRDVVAGTTTRVSVATGGAQGNADSTGPVAISRDGRYVLFETLATNLVGGTDGTNHDILMRDLTTGTTTLVKSFGSGRGDLDAVPRLAISDDGAYAAYEDHIGHIIYAVRQTLATGTEQRINPQHLTAGGIDLEGLSADGSRVLVVSDGDRQVRPGFYVVRHGTYVRDFAEGTITRLTKEVVSSGALSADGRWAVFSSIHRLARSDTNRYSDVYVRRISARHNHLISVGRSGRQANGDSVSRGISSDGRLVLFTSNASNLIRRDTNRAWDVFLRDRLEGTTRRCSKTADGKQSGKDSQVGVLSSDGLWAAFLTTGRLVAADTNRHVDVYLRGPGC
jgi:Tol biopolymer transport system component